MTAPSARDLNDLTVFTRVAETGSFTAAARDLGLPKSTVSRRVARLETALGVRLLARSTRKLSLTEAGELYFACAARILVELTETETALTEAQAIPKGRIRVAAPAEHSISSEVATRFMQAFPDVRVDMEFTGREVNVVEEGYDAAICVGKLASLSAVAAKLIESPIRIVASPDYLASHPAPTSAQDISNHACIAFGPPLPTTTWTLGRANDPVRLQITPRATFNNLAAVRTATIAGLGLALLPLLVCKNDIANGRLQVVLEEASPPDVPISLTYPAGPIRTRAARAFIDFVRSTFEDLAGPMEPPG